MQQSLSLDDDLLELYNVQDQNLRQSGISKIYQGINNQSHDKVTIRKSFINNEEFTLFKKIKDANKENLIKIQTIFQRGNVSTIIMERIDDDFYSYMTQSNEYKSLEYKQKKQIFTQMVAAVQQLHELDYIHQNLKPESFCIVTNHEGVRIIKLFQFHLGKPINFWMPLYLSPEIINNNQYDNTVDSWALGCIFFELLTGKPLFQGTKDQIIFKIKQIEQDEINRMVADGLKDFMIEIKNVQELLQKNPKNRKTVKTLNQQFSTRIEFPQQIYPKTQFNKEDNEIKKQNFEFQKQQTIILIYETKYQIQRYNEYFEQKINENNNQQQAQQIDYLLKEVIQKNNQQLEQIQQDKFKVENFKYFFQLDQIQNIQIKLMKAKKQSEDQFLLNQQQIQFLLDLKEIEKKQEQEQKDLQNNLDKQCLSEKEKMENLAQQFGIELKKTEDFTQTLADNKLIIRVTDIKKQSQQLFKQTYQFYEKQDIQTLIQEYQFRNSQIQDLLTQLNQIFIDYEIEQQQLKKEAQKQNFNFNNQNQSFILILEQFKNLQNIYITQYIEELEQQLICYQKYLDMHNQCVNKDQEIDLQKSKQILKQLDQQLQNLQKIEQQITNFLKEQQRKEELYNKKTQLLIENQNLMNTQKSQIQKILRQLQNFQNQNEQQFLQIRQFIKELNQYQLNQQTPEIQFQKLIGEQQRQLELDTEQNLQKQIQENLKFLASQQVFQKQIDQFENRFQQLEQENQIIFQQKQIKADSETLKQQMKCFDFKINFENYQRAMQERQKISAKFKTSLDYFRQCNQYFYQNQRVFQELKNQFEQNNDEFDILSQRLPEELQNLYQISVESKTSLDIIQNLFQQRLQAIQLQENQDEEQKAIKFWRNCFCINLQISKLDQEINNFTTIQYNSSQLQSYKDHIQQFKKSIDSIKQQINSIDKNHIEIYKKLIQNNIQSISSQIYLLIIFQSHLNLRILQRKNNKEAIKQLNIRFEYFKSELEKSKIATQDILDLIKEEEELEKNIVDYQSDYKFRMKLKLRGRLYNQKTISKILELLPYSEFSQVLIVQMIESGVDQEMIY